jgi:hypothetical protein
MRESKTPVPIVGHLKLDPIPDPSAPADVDVDVAVVVVDVDVVVVDYDTPLEKWTKKQLKDECELRGLPAWGTKAELMDRLLGF